MSLLSTVTLPMMQWPGEIDPFIVWLQSHNPKHILEIGTAGGGLSMLLGRVASGLMISVDLPSGSTSGRDQHACEDRNAVLRADNPRFVGILGDSHDVRVVARVRDVLQGEPLSLIFVDGDHTYSGLTKDVELYRPLARPNGWLAFHDINADAFESHGVDVPRYWREQPEPKSSWSVNGDWGGIGVLPA